MLKKFVWIIASLALLNGCGSEPKGATVSLTGPIPVDIQQKAELLMEEVDPTGASRSGQIVDLVKSEMKYIELNLTGTENDTKVVAKTVEDAYAYCRQGTYTLQSTTMDAIKDDFVEIVNLGRLICLDSPCDHILLVVEKTKSVNVGTDAIIRYTKVTSAMPVVFKRLSSDKTKYMAMDPVAGREMSDSYIDTMDSYEEATGYCKAAYPVKTTTTIGTGGSVTHNTGR